MNDAQGANADDHFDPGLVGAVQRMTVWILAEDRRLYCYLGFTFGFGIGLLLGAWSS